MQTRIVIVPGLNGSDDNHWQTWLEKQRDDTERLQGVDWTKPALFAWAEALENQLDKAPGQAILVAHSFGCLVSAVLAASRPDKVAGIILVAPASPARFSPQGLLDASQTERSITGCLPDRRLNTLGVLIASDNDPWLPLIQADQLSQSWGLAFFKAGKAGHINSESGFGEWPIIQDFVNALVEAIEPLPGDEVHQLGSWNRYRKRHLPNVNVKIDADSIQHGQLHYA